MLTDPKSHLSLKVAAKSLPNVAARLLQNQQVAVTLVQNCEFLKPEIENPNHWVPLKNISKEDSVVFRVSKWALMIGISDPAATQKICWCLVVFGIEWRIHHKGSYRARCFGTLLRCISFRCSSIQNVPFPLFNYGIDHRSEVPERLPRGNLSATFSTNSSGLIVLQLACW